MSWRAAVAIIAVLVLATALLVWPGPSRDETVPASLATDPRTAMPAAATTAAEQPQIGYPAPAAAKSRRVECNLIDLAPDLPGDYEDDDAALRDAWRDDIAVLQHSTNGEHLAVAALLAAANGDAETLLERAIAAGPDNPLVAWTALNVCDDNPVAGACANGTVERMALETDSDNGAVWARVAGRLLASGQPAAGYDALQHATTAPQFDTYFPEQILMLERAFAATTGDGYSARIMQAIGIAAAIVLPDAGVIETCRSETLPPARWPVCLAYGERLVGEGETELATGAGLAIQHAVHSAAGEAAALRRIEVRQAAFRRRVQSRDLQTETRLLFYDDNLLRQYMDVMLAEDEAAAVQFLGEETKRLLRLPGYDPCAAGS